MPLYYFDVFDGKRLWTDNVGEELADLYEAREQAQALLPDLARDQLPDGDHRDLTVTVRCSGGRPRYVATLSLNAKWLEPPTYPPGGRDSDLPDGRTTDEEASAA